MYIFQWVIENTRFDKYLLIEVIYFDFETLENVFFFEKLNTIPTKHCKYEIVGIIIHTYLGCT